jgi:carboxylesterase type B
VLWGESAGSISVLDQTIINGGQISHNGRNLFRGAIMNSGSTTPTVPVDHPKAQAIFDTAAWAAGCATAPDPLQCLRDLPFEQLSDAFAAGPSFFSYTSVDLSYLPRPDPVDGFMPESPEVAIQNDRFAKIPLIIGDQQDEGTLFSLTQSNISTTDDLIEYLTPIFPLANYDEVAGLVNAYPDDIEAGSPFNTFILNNIYPQFKRLAALLGDISFTMQRRRYLETVSSVVPTWSYNANYLPLTPVLGTFHASDVLSTFFNVPPVPTTTSILTYYISFINHLDPNRILNTRTWPQYDMESKQLLEFGAFAHGVITDTFRDGSYRYFKDNQGVFRV